MIEGFIEKKKELLSKLKILNKKFNEVENSYELDLGELKIKVNESIENLEKEKFSIALFGAFSDGKSSIVSAITKRLDIKIAPEPSTCDITCYEYGDWLIVDTPGLFSEKLLHDEPTKKYISEANVVIYTLDPVNPLKNSHHPTVKWLLSDINKIDSTIFVINKMDEIADLEDDEDYKRNSDIKIGVVVDTLKQIIELKSLPKSKIVCVSSDPFGHRLEHWFNNLDEYKKLSRIENLRNEINNFIKSAKDRLITSASFSVIEDTTNEAIKKLDLLRKEVEDKIEVLESQIEENTNKLSNFGKDINRNYVNIKEEIMNIRKGILQSIEASVDVSHLRSVMDSEVGREGYVIKEKINLIVQKYTHNLCEEQEKFLQNIEESLTFHNKIQENMIKSFANAGAKFGEGILRKSSRELGSFVLKTRDTLKLPVKFKPWGAIKWGNRVASFGKFLKTLPLIVESVTIVIKIYTEKKFNDEKNKIKQEIESLFKDFIETFTIEEYTKTYFPSVFEIKELENQLVASKKNYAQVLMNLDNSIYELKNLTNKG